MKHSIDGCLPFTATIEIEEIENRKICITVFNPVQGQESISLNKAQLHSFIGTLLHVQAKLKK